MIFFKSIQGRWSADFYDSLWRRVGIVRRKANGLAAADIPHPIYLPARGSSIYGSRAENVRASKSEVETDKRIAQPFRSTSEFRKEQFYQSLEPFMGEGNGEAISEAELTKMQNKTARHIQTGSLVRNYSSKADLVVVWVAALVYPFR